MSKLFKLYGEDIAIDLGTSNVLFLYVTYLTDFFIVFLHNKNKIM